LPQGPFFECSIRYLAHGNFSEMSPAPDWVHRPVVSRLCCLSGIRFWAKGSVEGFLDITLGGKRTRWTVQSDDLSKCITLTEATPTQVEEFERRKPVEVPSLSEPMPDEPLPEYAFRPVPPPSGAHAVVWFLSRTIFYALAQLGMWLLLSFDSMTVAWFSKSLAGGFAFAAKLLALPGSALNLEVDALGKSLLWGAVIASLIHWRTRCKARCVGTGTGGSDPI